MLTEKERALLRDLQAVLRKYDAAIEHSHGFCGVAFGAEACPTVRFYCLGSCFVTSGYRRSDEFFQHTIDGAADE
jgi:hypothetical protein